MKRVLKGFACFKFTVHSDCRSKSLRTGTPQLHGLVLYARQRIRRLLRCYFLTCLGKIPVIRSSTESLPNFWKYFWLFSHFLRRALCWSGACQTSRDLLRTGALFLGIYFQLIKGLYAYRNDEMRKSVAV